MKKYKNLITTILDKGQVRACRNGFTKSIFGYLLAFDELEKGRFPIITGRKIWWEGVEGEFKAFLEGATHLKDFEKYGCNYWKKWADKDGNLNLDYGVKWINWDGINQLQNVIDTIKTNPTDRRLLIIGYDPRNKDKVSLPSCHLLYQFYVRWGKYIDLIWYQRSVDVMIGLPSDIVMACIFNCYIAEKTGYKPGRVYMMLADTHIYEVHMPQVYEYLQTKTYQLPFYQYKNEKLELLGYKYDKIIKLEVIK